MVFTEGRHRLVGPGPSRGRRPMPRSELEALHRQLFDDLVERCEWRHRLTRSDSEDLVQEAFRVALDKKLRREGNAAAWLIRTIDFLALRHKSKVTRRARLLARWDPVPAASEDEETEENEP